MSPGWQWVSTPSELRFVSLGETPVTAEGIGGLIDLFAGPNPYIIAFDGIAVPPPELPIEGFASESFDPGSPGLLFGTEIVAPEPAGFAIAVSALIVGVGAVTMRKGRSTMVAK